MANEDDVISMRKRAKVGMEERIQENPAGNNEEIVQDQLVSNIEISEEMEVNIDNILERIERFTQQVSDILERGKTFFKDLSTEFEERMIIIHQEQMEKWQEEIKELRLLDATNEEAKARLHNAQYLLQSVHIDS